MILFLYFENETYIVSKSNQVTNIMYYGYDKSSSSSGIDIGENIKLYQTL